MKYSAGIDLGGTNIGAGIVSDDGQLIYKTSVPVIDPSDTDLLLTQISDAVKTCVSESGVGKIEFVGIGVPGIVMSEKGPVIFAPNIKWKEIDAAGAVSEQTGYPVILGNDADCAAVGEYRCGVGKNYENILMLTLGTGVGGAYIHDGRLFGFGKHGGEFGHITIVHDGVQCGCGKRGCFEVYASANALKRETWEEAERCPDSLIWQMCEGDPKKVKGRTAFDAAENGDEAGRRVVERYISYLADGIAGLCNIIRPDVVILGGGVAHQGDSLFDPLNEVFGPLCYSSDNVPVPKIIPAELGNKAGIIGAGLLGF